MAPHRINTANRKFYDSVHRATYVGRVRKVGLDSYPDLAQVLGCLRAKDRPGAVFWEIGACYGRVIDGLLQHTEKAKIEAWEYSPRIAAALRRRYLARRRVRVVHRDVLAARASRRSVDAALLMFSGLLEFSANEQKRLLALLARRIKAGGYLLMDLSALHVPVRQRSYTVARRGRILRFRLITREQLQCLVKAAGFECVRFEEYLTSTSRRLSGIFQRTVPIHGAA